MISTEAANCLGQYCPLPEPVFSRVSPVLSLHELKRDLNLYLKDWATSADIKTISDIVVFNEANAGKALRFGPVGTVLI